MTLLTLLDLSAAFDTVPHHQFLERLEKLYGIKGTALSWFSSHFTERYQKVLISNEFSTPVLLDTGMPQGSGTGPWGYSKYTGPLGVLLRLIRLCYHMFADDTQAHVSANSNFVGDHFKAKSTIEQSLLDIST